MAKHYVYRMDHDTGFAPHVSKTVCTLCGCKLTTVEAWAEPGSWVIGIGGNGTGRPDALIYALKFATTPTLGDLRRQSPHRAAYLAGRSLKPSAKVLVSHHFYYFGSNAVPLPSNLAHLIIARQGCKLSQRRELEAVAQRHGWKIVKVFKDEGISGTKDRDKRPGLDALLNGVTRKEFDLVAAWSVDRLGRSLKHLLSFLSELQAKDVNLYLHQQNIDTSTPSGEAIFQMCGVFSQFERAMIVERVKAGLRKAKAEGTKSGRPLGRPRISAEIEGKIREQLALGLGIHRVAKLVGCGSGTVQRVRASG